MVFSRVDFSRSERRATVPPLDPRGPGFSLTPGHLRDERQISHASPQPAAYCSGLRHIAICCSAALTTIAAEFDRAMRYKVGRRDLAEAGNVLVEPHMHRAVIGQRVQFAHRLEITSLTFMLNWVPLPVIQTCRGNMS